MADRTRIQELLSRYSWGYDTGDLDMVADCLHESVVVSIDEPDGTVVGPFEGKAAVLDHLRQTARDRPPSCRRIVSNVILEEEGQATATVLSYLTVLAARNGESRVIAHGWSRDHVIFDSAKWRFRARRLTIDVAHSHDSVESGSPSAP